MLGKQDWDGELTKVNEQEDVPKVHFLAAIRRVHPSTCTRWSIRFLWGQNNEVFSVFVLVGKPWQRRLLARSPSNHISNSNNPTDFFVSSPNNPKHRWDPPSLLFNGHRRLFFQEWKRPGSDTDPSPLSSVESTNEWGSASIAPYNLTLCTATNLIYYLVIKNS